MSLDVEKRPLYVPVGNPAPDFYDKDRPRANLYTNSIVALDVRTGKLAWYDQAVPHDVREFSTSSCRTRYGAFIILRKENCRVNLSNDRCK